MCDVMGDLETMGHGSDAVIISIGAVKFDPEKKQIYDRFYTKVDPQSCLDAGLSVSGSTITWWLDQSDAARREFTQGTLPSLKIALDHFTLWMNKQIIPGEKGNRFWGNGATFDNVILTNAYKALKMERPWGYRDDRCYRTLKALYPNVPFTPYGTHHNALHDAEAQALHLMEIWPHLRQS